jgi:hypothetical protein
MCTYRLELGPVIVRSPPLIARRLARVVGLEHLFEDMGVM